MKQNESASEGHNVSQEVVDGQTIVHTGETDAEGNAQTIVFGEKIDEDEVVMSEWGEDMEIISEHGDRGMDVL